MTEFRVPNRGSRLWFLLGGLLLVLAVLGVVFQHGDSGYGLSMVLGGLGVCAFAYTLYGVRRYIEFGDRIVVRYWLREQVIPWHEVAFVHFDRERGRFPLGLQAISIPTENHSLTIRLTDGGSVTVDIDPDSIAAVTNVVRQRARLDFQQEGERRQADALNAARWARRLVIAVALGISAIGIWLPVAMHRELIDGTNSAHWPTAPANLLRSELGSEVSTVRERRQSIEKTYYFPVVEYGYVVDGQAYTGTRLRFTPQRSTDRDEIEALVAVLQERPAMQAYYNPADPAVSVLIPGIPAERYVLAAMGVLAALGGLVYAAVKLVWHDEEASPAAAGSDQPLDLRTWTEDHEPRLVTAAVADHHAQASLCVALLEQHGIVARLAESAIGAAHPILSTDTGGFKILVMEQDAERAGRVLDEFDASQDKQILDSCHEWACPQCGEPVEGGFDLCWNCQTMRPGLEEATG